MAAKDAWLSEAIVDFLKGPCYITPLMGLIDTECMIFTPEEENKFQYTTAHDAFKALVDKLLTDFLGELGVTPEAFYEQVSKAQDADRLTTFVVQTILTVDDFMMFKAMMVKRNLDLTNQVLAAFGGANSPKPVVKAAAKPENKDESHLMDKAVELSKALGEAADKTNGVKKAMRALQVEDEEDALAVAIAASMREVLKADTELAEVNQAIALSIALEAERQRMLLEVETAGLRAALAAKGAAFEAELAKLRAALAAKGSATDAELTALRVTLSAKGFDAAEAELAAIRAALAVKGASVDTQIKELKDALAKQGATGKAAEAQVAALTEALKASATDPAVAAARVADAARSKTSFGAGTGATKGGSAAPAAAAAAAAAPAAASAAKAKSPAAAAAPAAGALPVLAKSTSRNASSSGGADAAADEPGQRSLKTSTSGRFMPAPIDAPTSSKTHVSEPISAPAAPAPAVVRSKAAGYKSSGPDTTGVVSLESIRAAAQAAAATQKNIVGAAGQDQQVWLDAQKSKLVAAKKAERDAEMEAYLTKMNTKTRGWAGQPASAVAAAKAGPAASTAETDAKRAALREKLASKMLQDMMQKS